MVAHPFYSNHSHYTSGPDIFHTGSTSFNVSGLPAVSYDNNYHGQTGFEMDENGYFDASLSNSLASSSTSGFQNTADNTTTTTPNNLNIHDDEVSITRSTPPPYLAYTQDCDDNKENQDWFDY
jgi:hypothetical protein